MGVRRLEKNERSVRGGKPMVGLVLCALLVVPVAFAGPAIKPSVPEVVRFTDEASEHLLRITGTALRRKLLFNVYTIAHYMQPPASGELATVIRSVLGDESVKQVTMIFLRELDAERIQRSLVEAIQRNSTEAEYQQILLFIGTFTKAIARDVEPGDEFTIRRFPGGTLVSLFEGREVSRINSRTFARVMWSIWFGERSVVDRTELLRFLTDNTYEAGG